MEPQRNVSGDGEHRWFEGGEWDRGRHGASAPDDADAARHTTESIDVSDLRRTPPSPPPPEYPPPADYPSSAYAPPAQPLYPASPAAGGNPGSPAAFAAPPATPAAAPSAGPAGFASPDSGFASPAPGAFGAPTAAVHTVPPAHQPAHQPVHQQPHHQSAAHHQPGLPPSVYTSRKPAVLIALVAVTALFEIPALRLLASATLADSVPASGVVAGTFLVLGLPVFAYGLHAMLGGGPAPEKLSAWLKQPLVYLPLGVLLFVLAALAA